MKNKFKLLLNIVSLCLSLTAIVIGVFSLTRANLNITGSLGYIKHEPVPKEAYLAKNWKDEVLATTANIPLISDDGASSSNVQLTKSNIVSMSFTNDLGFDTSVIGVSIGASALDENIHINSLPNNVADIQVYAKANDINYDVYIYSSGVINVISDCSKMFEGFSILTNINLSNFNTSNVTNMSSMFKDCNKLTGLDLSNFDTTKVTDMSYMFSNCRSLTSLDVSNFNTTNVTNMYYMFSLCSSLTSLNVSNFNTSKVTNMGGMFSFCSLTSLDLSNFNTSKVTDMCSMFSNCSSLTSLNISNFNTSKVTNMRSMFWRCSSLTSLDVSNFNTNNVTDMSQMFYSCSSLTTIYVSSYDSSNKTGWCIDNVTSSNNSMFFNCEKLKGGAGTIYDSNKTGKTYARIDGSLDANGNVLKGYLTDIKAKPTV